MRAINYCVVSWKFQKRENLTNTYQTTQLIYKAQIIILVSKGQTILESIWRFEGSIFDIEIVCLSGI